MKRDMDLVRKLLQWMEAAENGRNCAWKIEIEGYNSEQIGYHAYLLHQAGLILAADSTFSESLSPHWTPISITWDGHDFLSATKDDTTWAKAKKSIFDSSKAFTWKVLSKWLEAQADAAITQVQ